MSRPAAANPRYITHLLAWVTAATTIPSIALFMGAFGTPDRILLWIFVPSVYFYIGPILGLLQNVVPPQIGRQPARSLLFAANVAKPGDCPRQLIGWLSDCVCLGIGRRHRITQMGAADPVAQRLLGGVASGRRAKNDHRGRGCRQSGAKVPSQTIQTAGAGLTPVARRGVFIVLSAKSNGLGRQIQRAAGGGNGPREKMTLPRNEQPSSRKLFQLLPTFNSKRPTTGICRCAHGS